MTRLPAIKPKDVIRVLERAGFLFISQRGSHRKYRRESVTLVVPVHNDDMRPGTLLHIIRQSGLTVGEFIRSLKEN
ncbi:MAG: type II toxin-antitoxin system HicA family toxin [Candidatus Uhrbacteria bacterium]|nr:type II toxin-antitoxin system HicA family toxin [Candidatus Uhrbacteria bacterium]